MKSYLFRQIKAVDPKNKLDQVADVLIENGKIVKIAARIQEKADVEIPGKGLCLIPGMVDIHVHFREPGHEHKETLDTGVAAALHGGFVGCVTMPNTDPACDNQSVVTYLLKRAESLNFNLFPCGAITQGRKGQKLSEMAEMKKTGIVAVSDDGDYVTNSLVMRRGMEYASMFDLLVMSHALDTHLCCDGVMNEGYHSTVLGLKGQPNAGEEIAVSREIALAKLTGARMHITHASTKEAMDLVRQAKAAGLAVTCDVTPHHFSLTDETVSTYDSYFKMNPPLRALEDRQAIIAGLKDGTVDCIATDHAPHAEEEKEREFVAAPVGVIGLETSLGVVLTELYHKGILTFEQVIWKMSLAPADLIRKAGFNEIREGAEANLTVLDLEREWTVEKENFVSKSKNSCFIGKRLKGKACYTVCKGKVYLLEDNQIQEL